MAEKKSPKSESDVQQKSENDVQRRMREVLEAKQARNKSAHGEDHLGGRGVGPATNDVTKRQFRRKTGG